MTREPVDPTSSDIMRNVAEGTVSIVTAVPSESMQPEHAPVEWTCSVPFCKGHVQSLNPQGGCY